METPEQDDPQPAEHDPPPGHEGEDHREGAPGYDLDEQGAIEELERESEE